MRKTVLLTEKQREEIIYLYVNDQKSILDIHKEKNIPLSTIRYTLFKSKKLRTLKDAFALAKNKNKFTSKKGIKRGPMPQETKDKIKEKAIYRGETRSKGTTIKQSGYIEYTRGEHKGRRVHDVLMEKVLGRRLQKNEVVHHIDGNKSNNDINNLIVMDNKEHVRLHALNNYKKRKRDEHGKFK